MNKAIPPSRAFTRRMYAKFSGTEFEVLKKYHHVKLDNEFKEDCKVWLEFLTKHKIEEFSRPFLDCSKIFIGNDIGYTSDASVSKLKGFGCVYKKAWMYGQWPENFIKKYNPCIEFLELFALCMGIFTWIEELANDRIIIYCDNESVCRMVNHNTGGCKYSMVLVRRLALLCLRYSLRRHVKYIKSKDNDLSDALSRLQLNRFYRLTKDKGFHKYPTLPSTHLWPVDSFWEQYCANIP